MIGLSTAGWSLMLVSAFGFSDSRRGKRLVMIPYNCYHMQLSIGIVVVSNHLVTIRIGMGIFCTLVVCERLLEICTPPVCHLLHLYGHDLSSISKL